MILASWSRSGTESPGLAAIGDGVSAAWTAKGPVLYNRSVLI